MDQSQPITFHSISSEVGRHQTEDISFLFFFIKRHCLFSLLSRERCMHLYTAGHKSLVFFFIFVFTQLSYKRQWHLEPKLSLTGTLQ